MECIAKTLLSQKLFCMIRGSVLMFFGGLGTGFLILAALETGLRIGCFSKVTLAILNGTTKCGQRRAGGKNVVFGLLQQLSNYFLGIT